jgi:hypothetical protein
MNLPYDLLKLKLTGTPQAMKASVVPSALYLVSQSPIGAPDRLDFLPDSLKADATAIAST